MDQAQHSAIVNFIWGIADDVLRDIYVRGKYRDVILPMTVLRRLDVLLEPTKPSALARKAAFDAQGIMSQELGLRAAAGQSFYNTSRFTLRQLLDQPKQLRANFLDYLDGYSANVQEILDKFKFRNQIPTLVEADALGYLIEKFVDPKIHLGPAPIIGGDGTILKAGLDNHAMGTIFEELIRRFNEENNEEAGEHFTPRDVVELMAHLIFLPIADQIESGTYLVYDGAAGTGGMLTVAEEELATLARARGKDVSIHLYGQEINPETYAITKADLILKGEGTNAENIGFGSTLSADAYRAMDFDFMLSNPPYGKSWKTDLERMGGKSGFRDPRFVVEHGGDPEFSLLTRSSDGQLMFLVNLLSKMKRHTPRGSRIAEVHNGSSLFTGDAGQGESNIRRWVIENDWLEAIVALPTNMFYNTGIATYIWLLTNRKATHRRGKVQLIDATKRFQPLRKNLGQKNCRLGPADIQWITDTLLAFEDGEESKIFPNEAFGYWKVTVDRPLKLQTDLSDPALTRLRDLATAANEPALINVAAAVALTHGPGPHLDYNGLRTTFQHEAQKRNLRWTAKREKTLRDALCERNEAANPVIDPASMKSSNGLPPDELHGRYPIEIGGHPFVLTFESDPDLRDIEQVPLLEVGRVEGFIRREVLPHVPDAWVVPSSTKIGYEISFTRYFYKPVQLRTLEEIEADIRALEAETEGLLDEILVSVEP